MPGLPDEVGQLTLAAIPMVKGLDADSGRATIPVGTDRQEGAHTGVADPFVAAHSPTPWSARRINRVAQATGARTYLEIGVEQGSTFRAVTVPERTGVDPRFGFESELEADAHTRFEQVTSDRFFSTLSPEATFDFYYIDGLHTFEQTYRDVCNAILHSHHRTVLLVDDTQPSDVFSSLREQDRALRHRAESGGRSLAWHGDTFKVIFAVHDFYPGLDYRTIVGSGNGQTLIWRSNLGWRAPFYDSLEAISRLDYFDALDQLDIMRCTSEDDAIELCVSALRG